MISFFCKVSMFSKKVGKMKKVLLSATLLLASSAATVIAASSMSPATPAKVDAAAPATAPAAPVATTGEHHHKSGHHGMAHMTKEEIVAKLTSKGAEVQALGAKLTGLEKELFDSAMTRFNNSVKIVGGFSEKDTNPTLEATRAKHELRLAKLIAHHKDGYPTEKVAKWKEKFGVLKAEVSKLTGDKKSVAEGQVSNIESAFSDAEKAKDSVLLPVLLNTVKYEIDALKRVLHQAEHKAAEASKAATTATAPVVIMAAPTDATKPAETAKAS